jgi:tRNA-specific 2-thiouridylase
MKQKTVLVGMSGGVDSSVAAFLLQKQGYKVIGAFMKNFSETKNQITGECTWRQERRMAQVIAATLGTKFITLDFEKEYKKHIVDPMFRDYAKGLTPNPDILCNKIIKFPLLWKKAHKLGADYISTGHYARIKTTKSGFQLLAGEDKNKDQSYFLYQLSQKDLSHTLFPIGKLKKTEVRAIAKKNKFPNWDLKGTRGICFIGKIDMKSFLQKRIKEKKGQIKDPKGNLIGYHPGIMYFTIGQRVGPRLGFEIKKHLKGKWYIAEKKKNNTLTIAPSKHPLLKKKKIQIKALHLINSKETIPKSGVKARIRHLGPLNSGSLKKQKGKYTFTFSKPLEQIAEGQSIVLYHMNKVIGGGEIRLK